MRLLAVMLLVMSGTAYAGDEPRLPDFSKLMQLGSATNPLTINRYERRGGVSPLLLWALSRQQQRPAPAPVVLVMPAPAPTPVVAALPQDGGTFKVPDDAEWASWCSVARITADGTPACVLKKAER